MQPDQTTSEIPGKAALLSATDRFCCRLAEEMEGLNNSEPFVRKLVEILESDRLIRTAGTVGLSEASLEEFHESVVADFRDLLLIGPLDHLEKRPPCRI